LVACIGINEETQRSRRMPPAVAPDGRVAATS
jgi:hypothetical protein